MKLDEDDKRKPFDFFHCRLSLGSWRTLAHNGSSNLLKIDLHDRLVPRVTASQGWKQTMMMRHGNNTTLTFVRHPRRLSTVDMPNVLLTRGVVLSRPVPYLVKVDLYSSGHNFNYRLQNQSGGLIRIDSE